MLRFPTLSRKMILSGAALASMVGVGLLTTRSAPSSTEVKEGTSPVLFRITNRGPGFPRLPPWQRRLLGVEYGTTRLTKRVPKGGEALYDPGASTSSSDSAPLLMLQPASPTSSDGTAADADAGATQQFGPDITNTVFALATMPSEIPPPGVSAPSDAVINLPAWVVTITPPTPVGDPVCGLTSSSSSCPSATAGAFTDWIVIIDPSNDQMLDAFNQ